MRIWLENIYFFSYRAIDVQALIGIIGGYIGLFLGYSAMQIPFAIIFVIEKIKTCSIEMKVKMKAEDQIQPFEKGKSNIPSDLHVVEVKEISAEKDILESNCKVAQEYLIQELQKITEMKIE